MNDINLNGDRRKMYSKPVSFIVNFIFGVCFFFLIGIFILAVVGPFSADVDDMIGLWVFNLIWMSLCFTYNKWRYEQLNIQEYEKREFWLSLLVPLLCPTVLALIAILYL